jgi:hypothetical protein
MDLYRTFFLIGKFFNKKNPAAPGRSGALPHNKCQSAIFHHCDCPQKRDSRKTGFQGNAPHIFPSPLKKRGDFHQAGTNQYANNRKKRIASEIFTGFLCAFL